MTNYQTDETDEETEITRMTSEIAGGIMEMYEDLLMMITEDKMEIIDADRKVIETEEGVIEEIIIEVIIITQTPANYQDLRKILKTSIHATKHLP